MKVLPNEDRSGPVGIESTSPGGDARIYYKLVEKLLPPEFGTTSAPLK